MKYIVLISFLCVITSCTSISRGERERLNELRSYGIKADEVKGKDSLAAGALNILPGFGNFYLAFGSSGESQQALWGFFNLLAWPVSVIWGVPQAAIDANTLNHKETIYYYFFDLHGKKELEELRARFKK